jgi:hypothetical protein
MAVEIAEKLSYILLGEAADSAAENEVGDDYSYTPESTKYIEAQLLRGSSAMMSWV